jgi:hypothetical protein
VSIERVRDQGFHFFQCLQQFRQRSDGVCYLPLGGFIVETDDLDEAKVFATYGQESGAVWL